MDEDTKPKLTLVDISDRNVVDIPALLETLATEIRNGERGTVTAGVGVFLNEEGSVTVYGWGRDVDSVRAAGLLSVGGTSLVLAAG